MAHLAMPHAMPASQQPCLRLRLPLPRTAAAGSVPLRTASSLLLSLHAMPSCRRHLHNAPWPTAVRVRVALSSPAGVRAARPVAVGVLAFDRRQSTSAGGPPKGQGGEGPVPLRRSGRPAGQPQQGRPPFLRLLGQVLGGSLRSLFTPFRGQTLRKLYRQNPEELVLALIVLVACALVVLYLGRIYFTYFYSRQFTRYPPSVAKHLRRALYFGSYAPDPKRALKNYKLALEECDALGLDPFSDDVLGIRIQLAAWLESVQNYDGAIKILELLLADLRRWVDLMEASVRDGAVGGGIRRDEEAETSTAADSGLSSRLPPPLPPRLLWGPAAAPPTPEEEAARADEARADAETLWGRRARILKKAIGVSVKLGALYADDHVLDGDRAHERLVWSVDTALREFQRRTTDGVKPGEGPWMSPKEMGAALESLGASYESRSQFQLALPLFFQALRLCDDPCHTAVIMNNLAVSFAQHPLVPETLVGSVLDTPAAADKGSSSSKAPPPPPPTPQEMRRAYLETAQRWARNAHQHATTTAGAARTDECDEACVVALCTLGDIAVQLGDTADAKRRFTAARAMAEQLAFAAGVQQAQAGLARVAPPH